MLFSDRRLLSKRNKIGEGAYMSKEIKGAILQRDKETYAIVPRIPMGVLTPEILEKLAEVARKYAVRIIKITSGQRIALVGLKPEDVESAWKDLGMDIGPAEGLCVHYVQACPGTETCKFGQGDSLGLAAKIEKMYRGEGRVDSGQNQVRHLRLHAELRGKLCPGPRGILHP